MMKSQKPLETQRIWRDMLKLFLTKLISRKFILSVAIISVASVAMFIGIMAPTTFSVIAAAVLGLYGAGSVLTSRKASVEFSTALEGAPTTEDPKKPFDDSGVNSGASRKNGKA